MKRRTIWTLAAVGALLVIGAFVGLRPAGAPAGQAEGDYVLAAPIRKAAPDFSLPAYEGQKTIRLSDYKGKVVLVNFWATWCPPCRHEIPDFISVQDRLRPRGFEIVGISLDQGGAADVAPFAKEMGINYTVALGDNDVTERYGGIRGIPTSFLIDREGRIARTFPGMIDGTLLEASVKALL